MCYNISVVGTTLVIEGFSMKEGLLGKNDFKSVSVFTKGFLRKTKLVFLDSTVVRLFIGNKMFHSKY